MPRIEHPGVLVEETGGARPIEGVPTGTAAFLGACGRGPLKPRLVASFTEYLNLYGANGPFLPDAVRGFFENGGTRAFICR